MAFTPLSGTFSSIKVTAFRPYPRRRYSVSTYSSSMNASCPWNSKLNPAVSMTYSTVLFPSQSIHPPPNTGRDRNFRKEARAAASSNWIFPGSCFAKWRFMRSSSGSSSGVASRIIASGTLLTALFDQFCDQAGPAGLMACADPGAIVAMKVFVEKDEVAPVRIALKELGATRHGPPPVRIPPKEPRRGFRRLVLHAAGVSVHVHFVRMVLVKARKSAHPVRRKKLRFVQHAAEHALELLAAHQRKQPAHPARGALRHFDVFRHVRMIVDKPLHAALEARKAIHDLRLQRFHRE